MIGEELIAVRERLTRVETLLESVDARLAPIEELGKQVIRNTDRMASHEKIAVVLTGLLSLGIAALALLV